MVSWAVLPSAGLLQSYIIISRKNNARPHRLVWPRTQAFQACDWGSNPHGDASICIDASSKGFEASERRRIGGRGCESKTDRQRARGAYEARLRQSEVGKSPWGRHSGW